MLAPTHLPAQLPCYSSQSTTLVPNYDHLYLDKTAGACGLNIEAEAVLFQIGRNKRQSQDLKVPSRLIHRVLPTNLPYILPAILLHILPTILPLILLIILVSILLTFLPYNLLAIMLHILFTILPYILRAI